MIKDQHLRLRHILLQSSGGGVSSLAGSENDDFHRKAPLEIIISHGNIRRFRPASSSKHKKGEKKRQCRMSGTVAETPEQYKQCRKFGENQ